MRQPSTRASSAESGINSMGGVDSKFTSLTSGVIIEIKGMVRSTERRKNPAGSALVFRPTDAALMRNQKMPQGSPLLLLNIRIRSLTPWEGGLFSGGLQRAVLLRYLVEADLNIRI